MTPDALLEQLVELVAERVLARVEPSPPPPAEPWRLLDATEAGLLLGRSKSWVHAAVRERGLPYVRLDGGAKMFCPVQLRVWAEARQVGGKGSER